MISIVVGFNKYVQYSFHIAFPKLLMTKALFLDEYGTGMNVELRAKESILGAAHRVGIEIPAGCFRGRCGTCECTDVTHDEPMEHLRVCSTVPLETVDQIRILLKKGVRIRSCDENIDQVILPAFPSGRVEVIAVDTQAGFIQAEIGSMVEGKPHYLHERIKIEELCDTNHARRGEVFYRKR